SSTISFVQPAEFTIIGFPAESESNNLFGELVYKMGKSLKLTVETSDKLTISETSFIGNFPRNLTFVKSFLLTSSIKSFSVDPPPTNKNSTSSTSFINLADSIIVCAPFANPKDPKCITLNELIFKPNSVIMFMFFSLGQNSSILAILGIIDAFSLGIYFITP